VLDLQTLFFSGWARITHLLSKFKTTLRKPETNNAKNKGEFTSQVANKRTKGEKELELTSRPLWKV
jgi:hypothetical protein